MSRAGPALRLALAALAAAAAAAALGLGFRVFPEEELGRKPYPLKRIDVDFPPDRGGLEYYGRLRLALVIGRDGAVERLDLVDSTLSAAHVAAASKAFGQARWEPGTFWGVPVRSRKVVEVVLEPPSRSLERALTRPDS